MSTPIYKSAIGAIERAKHPLIIIPKGGGSDSIASALGIAQLLVKLEKPHTIVTADGAVPKHLAFLGPKVSAIETELKKIRTYIIRVNMNESRVEELSYDVQDDQLEIYLSPKSGGWTDRDLELSSQSYRHDLIICLGAPNLEACAHIFKDHPDFFFRTPIINIDHTTVNEHFGHYNIVDVTASSCGEVCHDWIESISPALIDETMATDLLTGMISKTRSFRTQGVTPKTLQVASSLMAKGAKRDAIVKHLYRTRSINTLRLWGRALARLKSSEDHKLVWTLLSRQDFMHAGSQAGELSGVVEELISSSPNAKVATIIYEDQDGTTCALVHAHRPHDALTLTMPFRPAGTHKEVQLCFPEKNIVEVERLLTEHMKKEIAR